MDQVTSIDLRTAPVLTKATEALRDKISAYVERMHYAGKPVQQIVVFAGDYDTAIGAVNRKRNKGLAKDEPKRPPVTALEWGGGAGNAWSPRWQRTVTA